MGKLYFLYPGQSPYNYCLNSPINVIDQNGLKPLGWVDPFNMLWAMHQNNQYKNWVSMGGGDRREDFFVDMGGVDTWWPEGTGQYDPKIDDPTDPSKKSYSPVGYWKPKKINKIYGPGVGWSGTEPLVLLNYDLEYEWVDAYDWDDALMGGINFGLTGAGAYTTLSGGRFAYGGMYYNAHAAKWYSTKYYGNNWLSSSARSEALLSARAFKLAGRFMFGLSAGISFFEAFDAGLQGNWGKVGLSALDIGMNAIGTFCGPPGFVIMGAYYMGKYFPNPERQFDVNYNLPQYTFCFIAGTEIIMGNGTIKNIEDVDVGDSVKTYNLETKRIENNIVSKIDTPYHEHFILIQFDNGIVNTNTPDHPYYVKGKGWCSYAPEETKAKYNLEVNQLNEREICYYYTDGKVVETKIKKIQDVKKMQKTYNLSKVSNNKNYFANGVLVHNK